MPPDSLFSIFLNAVLINNFVLAQFLGLCSFLGVSNKVKTAGNMGLAVTFVSLISSLSAYGVNLLLVRFQLEFLRLIVYIAIIAAAVQLVELLIKKYSPALFRTLGIYLPLISTNCAILGIALFQTSRSYNLPQCLTFSVGAGLGYTLAMLLMAGLREKLDLATLPGLARGTALTLVIAGLMSLAFMGFAGLGG